MKKTIFFYLLLFISVSSFSQQTNLRSQMTKQDYLSKSKRQNTKGLVMGSVGIALLVTDLAFVLHNYDPLGGLEKSKPTTFLTIGSLTMLAGSTIFYSASKKSKRKAMSLSFEK
jgi:hypothetical protein